MLYSLKRMWALLGVVAAVAAVAASSAVASHKAGPTIVIWTDSDRAAAVTKVANDWASSSGATIKVVTKNFGDIRDNLSTVAAADAPDVITAAHDWTGQLAANGLVEPIFLSNAVKVNFPSYTLNAFSYGTAVKKLYGVPAAVENIGLVANPTFLKNAHLIDKWNKEGLISSKVDSSAAQNAFLKGQAAFWITGPWNADTLKKSGLSFKVIQVPAIAKPSVPFLGVQGFMVTKFASTHGVDSAAKDLVTNFMASPAAQTQLAAANGSPPAHIKAKSSDPVL